MCGQRVSLGKFEVAVFDSRYCKVKGVFLNANARQRSQQLLSSMERRSTDGCYITGQELQVVLFVSTHPSTAL